jgi:dihydroorotate dehydrogenase electron transfer subunit
MALDAPGIKKGARPGQFVQVRCSDGLEPFLRRPFSVHRLRPLEILYEVVGRGTEILCSKKKGEWLDLLGPLGTGFSLPLRDAGSRAILVAGGIGVAPLVFLAEVLAEREIETIVLIGAKTKNLILCEKDFKAKGAGFHIATDDGSRGSKGLVSKLFEKIIETVKKKSAGSTCSRQEIKVYACGPNPMLRSIASICEQEGLGCEVSVEERMACGFGVCLGCAVKLKGGGGYKLACKDGPVFSADKIAWQVI